MKLTTDSALRRERLGASGRRSGFTLVELLTVIAIIGMLSAISITTVRASIQSAKETQTRTTIAKIDNVLTACYEKYQYRRVDLTGYAASDRINPSDRAKLRLNVLRDLLRCDFPCTPTELDTVSSFNASPASSYTPLQDALRFAANGSLSAFDLVDENYPEQTFSTNHGGYPHVANAELLYLVVMNADPEARALFSEREIGDVDGNGLYEFVDGWGNPICWMRWAPGLESSDRQPLYEDVHDPATGDLSVADGDLDPMDPMRQGDGWFLVPYVFSPGPDGKYGLWMPNPSDVTQMNDPFKGVLSTNGPVDGPVNVGAPYSKSYKDNIDNHTLVR